MDDLPTRRDDEYPVLRGLTKKGRQNSGGIKPPNKDELPSAVADAVVHPIHQ
jgi:hypothetical protein